MLTHRAYGTARHAGSIVRFSSTHTHERDAREFIVGEGRERVEDTGTEESEMRSSENTRYTPRTSRFEVSVRLARRDRYDACSTFTLIE